MEKIGAAPHQKIEEGRDDMREHHGVFDAEVMSSMAEAADILGEKETYLGDRKARNIIEYATGMVLGIVGGAAERAFDVGVRAAVDTWFSYHEQHNKEHPSARRVEVSVCGRPESSRTVMYIPGMFDGHVQDRMKSIVNGSDLAKKDEYWMAIETLYSARDIPRVRAIIDDLEKRLVERLDTGGAATIVGYSCGGLIGKVLADKLSGRFPGKVGLVVHNAPLDPRNGFFVRYAGFEQLQKEIGFTPEHSKSEYPFIILNGAKDMIVPCQECLEQGSGEHIRTKPIPGGHQDSCIDSPKAARRVYAAVRAVERHMFEYGNKKVA